MQFGITILVLCFAIVSGYTIPEQRIVGGTPATIDQYPFGVVILFARQLDIYGQWCGGSILTTTAILSAAHCFETGGVPHSPAQHRVRIGSTFASSGGTVLAVRLIPFHPTYNFQTLDGDIAIVRTSSAITYGPVIQRVSIAGSNYNLADNQAVWAFGWGATLNQQENPEHLRHVQVYTINQQICRQRYQFSREVTPGMVCSGVLDVGGRDQCSGDSGGPLLHNNVVVGVCSWGAGCASAYYPGVNARVSFYSNWIISTAEA